MPPILSTQNGKNQNNDGQLPHQPTSDQIQPQSDVVIQPQSNDNNLLRNEPGEKNEAPTSDDLRQLGPKVLDPFLAERLKRNQNVQTRVQAPSQPLNILRQIAGLKPKTRRVIEPKEEQTTQTIELPDLPKQEPLPKQTHYEALGFYFDGSTEPSGYMILASAAERLSKAKDPELRKRIKEARDTLLNEIKREEYHKKMGWDSPLESKEGKSLKEKKEKKAKEDKEKQQKKEVPPTIQTPSINENRQTALEKLKGDGTNPYKWKTEELIDSLAEIDLGDGMTLLNDPEARFRKNRQKYVNSGPWWKRVADFAKDFVGIKKKSARFSPATLQTLSQIRKDAQQKKTTKDEEYTKRNAEILYQETSSRRSYSKEKRKIKLRALSRALQQRRELGQSRRSNIEIVQSQYPTDSNAMSYRPANQPNQYTSPNQKSLVQRGRDIRQTMQTAQKAKGLASKGVGLLRGCFGRLFSMLGLGGFGFTLGGFAVFLLVLIIIILLIVFIAAMISLTDATQQTLNKELSDTGSANFFEYLDFGGQNPTFTLDGAGNVTSVALFVESKLNSEAEYNRLRQESGVEVEGIVFSLIPGFQSFERSITVKVGNDPIPFDDYNAAGIAFSPKYCTNNDCVEEVREKQLININFAQSVPKSQFNNQFCVNFTGEITTNTDLINGLVAKPLPMFQKCWSLLRDPSDAEISTISRVGNAPPTGPQPTGVLQPGADKYCGVGFLAGEVIRCTNPYSSSHPAVDINVGTGTSQQSNRLPDSEIYNRPIYSPIDAIVAEIPRSSDYIYYAGRALRLTATTNQEEYRLYHIEYSEEIIKYLRGEIRDSSGQVTYSIPAGTVVGYMYRGVPGRDDYWTGPHIHWEHYIFTGSSILTSNPSVLQDIINACGANNVDICGD